MKLFKKLFNNLWIGRLCTTVASLRQYSKDYGIISDTLYSKEFSLVLHRYLNTNFSKDWIGRLYAVINPNIDIDGKINFSNVIIEIDDENTNSNEYVKSWVYKQMQLIGDIFKINKLYDYISVEFKHVGPVTHDNYLVIFDITSRKYFVSDLKKLGIHTCVYGAIALALIMIL